MATTPNMSLILPTVQATLGPEWATQLNNALTLVDTHDHSTGRGVKITPSGLNINSDLSLLLNSLVNAKKVQFSTQAVTLADINSIYSVLGDLYWNNGGGTPVKITTGTSVNAPTATAANTFNRVAISSNTAIAPADPYSFYDTNTSSAVTYTLPLASSVAAGRFYEFKDTTGNAATNNITIQKNGGAGTDYIDGLTVSPYVLKQNYGSVRLVSNGTDRWSTNNPNLVVLNWTAFTPSGTWTTNCTYTGFYRRVGDSVDVRINIALAGAPGGTAGLSVNGPIGSIDTSKIPNATVMTPLGYGVFFDSSAVTPYILSVAYGTGSQVNIKYVASGGQTFALLSNTVPVTAATGDYVQLCYTVPLSLWAL